jgi:hypothetical protein
MTNLKDIIHGMVTYSDVIMFERPLIALSDQGLQELM